MSLFASLTATEYWKQNDAILADMSITAITLAASERAIHDTARSRGSSGRGSSVEART